MPPERFRSSDVHELGPEPDAAHPPRAGEAVEVHAGLPVPTHALERRDAARQAAPDELRRRLLRLDVDLGHPVRFREADDVGALEVAGREEAQHHLVVAGEHGKQAREAVHRLPDRVREPEEDDVPGRQAVEAEQEGICDRLRIPLHDDGAQSLGALGDVSLLRPRHDPQLVAGSSAHPLDEVVEHRPAAHRQHFLRARKRL